MKIAFLGFGLSLFLIGAAFAQTGGIRGVAVEATTQEPLAGVNVLLQGTNRGAATDGRGEYVIPNLNVGGYTLVFSLIGYEKHVVTDVMVKSNKTAYVSARLREQAIASREEIVVTAASFFNKENDTPVSARSLNYEEVRRSPGAREDVSRMIQNLPGVTPTTDDRNDLVVRGGSPSEVLFLIDNIEIPNPNHFGTQGATGGPISMVNNELIDAVNFMAGGFPSRYGNKLSGVLDIKFREGNGQGVNGKFDLNFAGAGGIFEGPVKKSQGSWLASFHRSYLDFLESALKIGGLPIYSNFQAKLAYNLSSDAKLSLIGIGGVDQIEIDVEPDRDDYTPGETDTSEITHIINKTNQYTAGANLAKIWSPKLLSNFTLSHSYNKFFIDFNERTHAIARPLGQRDLKLALLPNGHHDVYDNASVERATDIKTDWTYLFENKDELAFGAQVKLVQFDHAVVLQPFDSLDIVGSPSKPVVVAAKQSPTPKAGVYVSLVKKISPRLNAALGGRYDYFDLLGTHDFSPRFSLSYALHHRLTMSGAAGIFHQSPELLYITGDPQNKKTLQSIRSDHFVAGFDYLLSEATLFSAEIYRKNYFHYPVASDSDFAFYSTANSGGAYGAVDSKALVSAGKGQAWGFELLLQKKLVSGLYGLAGYSYSQIRHQAKDGIWRSGEFDNRHVINLVAGYRLNKAFEFSAKWRYAGGRPYTPFDATASVAAGRGILDLSRLNAERFTPYHKLDLRYDHRKYFKKLTLVSYFSVENVLNRRNQGLVLWNKKLAATKRSYQTGIFPVGGVSLEF